MFYISQTRELTKYSSLMIEINNAGILCRKICENKTNIIYNVNFATDLCYQRLRAYSKRSVVYRRGLRSPFHPLVHS